MSRRIYTSSSREDAVQIFDELKKSNNYYFLTLSTRTEMYCGWENNITEIDWYYIEEFDNLEEGEEEDYQCSVLYVYDGRAFMRDKKLNDILYGD